MALYTTSSSGVSSGINVTKFRIGLLACSCAKSHIKWLFSNNTRIRMTTFLNSIFFWQWSTNLYSQEDICIIWMYKEGLIIYVLPLFCSAWQIPNWAPSMPQTFSYSNAVKWILPVTPTEIIFKNLSYCSQHWPMSSSFISKDHEQKGFITPVSIS